MLWIIPCCLWIARRTHSPRRTRIKDTSPCDLQSRDACPCELLILYPCGSTPARVLQYLGGSTAVLWAEYWCNPRQSTVVLSTEYCVNHTNWCSPHNSYVLDNVSLCIADCQEHVHKLAYITNQNIQKSNLNLEPLTGHPSKEYTNPKVSMLWIIPCSLWIKLIVQYRNETLRYDK